MTTDRPTAPAAVRRLLARAVRSHRVLPGVGDRHVEPSLIAPPPPGTGDGVLARTLVDAAQRILSGDLDEHMARDEERLHSAEQRSWWRTWPGEHYRLLAAITATIPARKVVEVGTYTGMGTLAMLAGGATHVTTYDVVAWERFGHSALRQDDMTARVTQRLFDVASRDVFVAELPTLAEADLVFIDGPKDWVFEPALFALLAEHRASLGRPLFVVDDVRTLPLVRTWLGMDWRSMDATSLGHWSGTGLARFA